MGQYHYVGSLAVGPFTAAGLFGSGSATMPQVHASFSHGLIAVGLGMRL